MVSKTFWFNVLSLVLGIVFLFSAFSKLFPLELFEYMLVDIGLFNWSQAPIIARLLIGFEFGLGFLLSIHFYGPRKIVLKTTLLLLLFFCAFLVFQLIKEGDDGNCGCFGSMLKMTPSESIVKNIVLIGITIILIRFNTTLVMGKLDNIIWTGALFFILFPFVLSPINMREDFSVQKEYALDFSLLYKGTSPPKIDLEKGKKIIAFVSLTCAHCKMGAYKLHLIKRNNPTLPIYMIMNGSESDKKAFYDESKSEDIPFSMMTNQEGFMKNAGFNEDGSFTLPTILFVNDGKVIRRVNHLHLDQKEIEDWINNKN